MDSPFLFPLPCHDSLGQSRDLDLLIYISSISPLWLPSWTEPEDIDLPIYIWCFLFRQTILFPIPLLMVWSYSDTSTLSSQGTFLVCLSIVLSLRKAPSGLVYKPTYVFPLSLASSTHQLPSNLVSPLELSPVSSPYRLSDDRTIDPQESSNPS